MFDADVFYYQYYFVLEMLLSLDTSLYVGQARSSYGTQHFSCLHVATATATAARGVHDPPCITGTLQKQCL